MDCQSGDGVGAAGHAAISQILSGGLECSICGEEHETDACEQVTSAVKVQDSVVVSRARQTLPGSLYLEVERDATSVIAKQLLHAKTQFGPFEAPIIPATECYEDKGFILKVFHQEIPQAFKLVTDDEDMCNWMCLVRPAFTCEQQNLFAFELQNHIYFSTNRTVEPGEELRVWYAPHYARKLGKVTSPGGTQRAISSPPLNQTVTSTSSVDVEGVTPITADVPCHSTATATIEMSHSTPSCLEDSQAAPDVGQCHSVPSSPKKYSQSCGHCQVTFVTKLEVMQHNGQLHPRVAAPRLYGTGKDNYGAFCTKCNILFPSRQHLDRIHCVETDGLSVDNTDRESPRQAHTNSCDINDQKKATVRSNAPRGRPPGTLKKKRGRKPKAINQLKNVRGSIARTISCAICGLEFATKSILSAHSKEHELPINDRNANIGSPHRSMKLVVRKYNPLEHSSTNEQMHGAPAKRRSSANSVMWKCQSCFQKFHTNSDLEDHLFATHGMRLLKQKNVQKNGVVKKIKPSKQFEDDEKNTIEGSRTQTSVVAADVVTQFQDSSSQRSISAQPVDARQEQVVSSSSTSHVLVEWSCASCTNTFHTKEELTLHVNLEHPSAAIEGKSQKLAARQCQLAAEMEAKAEPHWPSAEADECGTIGDQKEANTHDDGEQVLKLGNHGDGLTTMNPIDGSRRFEDGDSLPEIQADCRLQQQQAASCSVGQTSASETYLKKRRANMAAKQRRRKQAEQQKDVSTSPVDDSTTRSYDELPDAVPYDRDYYADLLDLTDAEDTGNAGDNGYASQSPSQLLAVDLTCQVCEKKFYDVGALKAHTSDSHRDVLACDRCERVFVDAAWLRRHVCGVGEGEYGCSVDGCGRSFGERGHLALHEEHHRKPFYCDDCHVSYADARGFCEHACAGDGRVAHCDACGCVQRNRLILAKHELACCRRRNKCFACRRPLASAERMTEHFNYCAKRLELRRQRVVTCFRCASGFDDAMALRLHMFEHEHPFACDDCGMRFASSVGLDLHACHPPRTFRCERCDVQFRVPALCARHLQHHERNPSEAGRKYRCKRCGGTFWDRHFAGRHACLAQKLPGGERRGAGEKRREFFECNVCGALQTTKGNIGRHMREVHGDARFTCDKCGRCFRSKSAFDTHVHVTHADAKNFLCSVCGATFKQRTSLRYHVRTAHERRRAFPCVRCERSYATQSQLAVHQAAQHEPARARTPCAQCGQTFASRRALALHVLRCHRRRELPYECGACGKAYLRAGELRAHLDAKHASAFFVCQFCAKMIATQPALRLHYRRKHADQRDAWKQEAVAAVAHESRGAPVMHRCGFCGEEFRELACLKAHVQDSHLSQMRQLMAGAAAASADVATPAPGLGEARVAVDALQQPQDFAALTDALCSANAAQQSDLGAADTLIILSAAAVSNATPEREEQEVATRMAADAGSTLEADCYARVEEQEVVTRMAVDAGSTLEADCYARVEEQQVATRMAVDAGSTLEADCYARIASADVLVNEDESEQNELTLRASEPSDACVSARDPQLLIGEEGSTVISVQIPSEEGSEVYALISGIETEEELQRTLEQLAHGDVVYSTSME
ncbi:PREDICTED: uncharacterized protein LOC106805592 [Priapulus caudatus]|uniref:Uncharacterized protein LOC106805592 n=1 Tax=Priapulus caudatus TaxID=37621 RepID=A0ABM1DS11_PRICU|nr:PREDICTED: uncharacterized protein LOC106805592 [Priapulus caudatus]